MREEEKSNFSNAIKYTGVFGGVQVIILFAALVRNKLVALMLGPSGLGLISVYNSVVKLLNDSTNLGISFSSVRNISEIAAENDTEKLRDYISVVRSWSLLTALLGMLVCVSLSGPISYVTFDTYDYTFSIMLLSPIIGLMAISGGELAILKGTRQLKKVATSSVLGALSTLFLSIPIYFVWGMEGIVPAFIVTTLATTLIIIRYSYLLFPFRKPGRVRDDLRAGVNMIRLGISFILAGILGSMVEYVIRAYILRVSSLDVAGFYNAGYAIAVTYAGMIFAAMETDYFPRLSAVNRDPIQLNKTVNQQIEVAILLIAPLMVVFLIFMPVILPLLYSSAFLPVIGMAECAVFGMLAKAVTLPIAYITLAKGDSVLYLIIEFVYDVTLVVLVIWGFNSYGLSGAGVAISLAASLHVVTVCFFTYVKYRYRLSKGVFVMFAVQVPWVIIAFVLTFIERNVGYWLGGIACLLVSFLLSLYILHKKTTILTSLRNRFNL